ncbi:DUF2442 domain-containing protein [Peribacillus acanthi]|uniref:DUF2442 domain-containing protein n=1 Tax=Peribacillus acanthi TaxID=2171554 RepID=UPI000D3EDBDC|nr:DUF2442 domain-containing protein [Peribacillus acanthi]
MRITSLFATTTFKLLLEFDSSEYRLLDIKQFLQSDLGKLREIREDINVFCSIEIDKDSGTVLFCNGVDFDTEILYTSSVSLEHIFGNKGGR